MFDCVVRISGQARVARIRNMSLLLTARFVCIEHQKSRAHSQQRVANTVVVNIDFTKKRIFVDIEDKRARRTSLLSGGSWELHSASRSHGKHDRGLGCLKL